MKKMSKILSVVAMIVVFVLCFQFVLANQATIPSAGQANDKINNASLKVFGTFYLIARIIGFALLMVAGVRYMFAAADTRANIKKQTVILCIGAVIIFSTETIINFVVDIFESLFA